MLLRTGGASPYFDELRRRRQEERQRALEELSQAQAEERYQKHYAQTRADQLADVQAADTRWQQREEAKLAREAAEKEARRAEDEAVALMKGSLAQVFSNPGQEVVFENKNIPAEYRGYLDDPNTDEDAVGLSYDPATKQLGWNLYGKPNEAGERPVLRSIVNKHGDVFARNLGFDVYQEPKGGEGGTGGAGGAGGKGWTDEEPGYITTKEGRRVRGAGHMEGDVLVFTPYGQQPQRIMGGVMTTDRLFQDEVARVQDKLRKSLITDENQKTGERTWAGGTLPLVTKGKKTTVRKVGGESYGRSEATNALVNFHTKVQIALEDEARRRDLPPDNPRIVVAAINAAARRTGLDKVEVRVMDDVKAPDGTIKREERWILFPDYFYRHYRDEWQPSKD